LALETDVIATGARPGDSTSKRELFTEETKTVLVFENGAVIRLTAAVADGQLLYLTNKATGKEVVTQVLRKRAFRPTNCYVDLQFTESCPGFWAVDFPKAAAPPNPAVVAKKLAADEDPESAPVRVTIAPSVQEIDKLKNEVAKLQTQLKSLQQPGETPISDVAPAPGSKAAFQISADLMKKEEEKRLEELFAMETHQEQSGSPKRLVAYPQKSGKKTAVEHVTERWKTVVALLLLLVATVTYAYRFGLLDPWVKTVVAAKPAPSAPRPVSSAPVKPPAASTVAVGPKTSVASGVTNSVANNVAAGNAAVPPAVSQPNKPNSPAPITSAASAKPGEAKSVDGSAPPTKFVFPARSPDPVDAVLDSSAVVVASGAKHSKKHVAPNMYSSGKATAPGGPAAPAAAETTATASAAPESYIAPKLLRGSKSVAPPEAIRNYVAGDVTMDALVDSSGHVQSVKVVSGPTKLYATATEVMKQYVYEPARKNGKAVPAHVQVSLQFWYAP
jgi:hypothetical protein